MVFESITNFINEKIEQRKIRSDNIKEEQAVLEKARHEERLKSAPLIAKTEEKKHLKEILEGKKTSEDKGILSKFMEMSRNVHDNLEKDSGKGFGMPNINKNQSMIGNMGDFTFDNPFALKPDKKKQKKHHKKSKKNHDNNNQSKHKNTGKDIHIHLSK